MATPTIRIDQPTPGVGVAGQSRGDLILGEVVTLTDPANGAGTYLWELIDIPVGSSVSLTGAATDTATFTPDVAGTYLVKLTFNTTDVSGANDAIGQFISTQGGCGVATAGGLRIPAAGETTQFGAEGWQNAMDVVIRQVEANIGGGGGNTLDAAYDQGGSGSGRAITADANAVTISSTAADNNNIFELTKSPAGSQSGSALLVTLGANTTGPAISILNSGSGSGLTTDSPVSLPDGAVGACAWALTNAATGGFSANSATQLSMAVNGVERCRWTSGGQMFVPNGAANAPGIAPLGQTNKGVFNPGTNRLGISIRATQVAEWAADGSFIMSPIAETTGNPSALVVNGAAHTTLTANSTVNEIHLNMARTIQFATGDSVTYKTVSISQPTVGFVASSTLSDATTFHIEGAPSQGTNCTLSNARALHVESGLSHFEGPAQFGDDVGFFGVTPVSQQTDFGALTLPTGGVDNVLATVSGTGDDTNVNDNFADLGSQVNDVRTVLRNLGLMA